MKPIVATVTLCVASLLAGCATQTPVVPALEGKPFVKINSLPAPQSSRAAPADSSPKESK